MRPVMTPPRCSVMSRVTVCPSVTVKDRPGSILIGDELAMAKPTLIAWRV
jgi:hypothetical protein